MNFMVIVFAAMVIAYIRDSFSTNLVTLFKLLSSENNHTFTVNQSTISKTKLLNLTKTQTEDSRMKWMMIGSKVSSYSIASNKVSRKHDRKHSLKLEFKAPHHANESEIHETSPPATLKYDSFISLPLCTCYNRTQILFIWS